jgi:hypothetical protein
MRCHRTLEDWIFKTLDRSKRVHLQEIMAKEADLPATRTTVEDPMNYHQ